MDVQENTLFAFKDDKMKSKNEGLAADVTSGPISGSENDFTCHYMENKSISGRDEPISTSNLNLDVLPDFPTLYASYNRGQIDASDQDSLQTELINDFTDSSNLNAVRDCTMEFLPSDAIPDEDSFMVHKSYSFSTSSTVQLDTKPEISANEHDDKASASFLDCDWDSIEDFDLDAVFRSDSIDHFFGDDMMDVSDGLFSPSDHLISGITEFVPVPDAAFCKEELSDKEFSSLLLDEGCDAKGNVSQRSQVDEHANLLTYWEKEEEKSKKIISLQRKTSGEESVVCVGTCNDIISIDTGYPSYAFPAIEGDSDVCAEHSKKEYFSSCQFCHLDPWRHSSSAFGYRHAQRNQKKPISSCDRGKADPSVHPNPVQKRPAISITPQERNGKPKQMQITQSRFEVQHKRKQYDDMKSGSDSSICQTSPGNSHSQIMTNIVGSKEICNDLTVMEKNMLVDAPRISIVNDDNSIAETTYCQLQAALSMLDNRLKFCIRDSMFRLAKSATERHNITDRNGTNKDNVEKNAAANGEADNKCRSRNLSASETDTNPVDRIVAQLLFQRPSKLSS
ncbi:hypothetical protein BHE74_00029223 [Ensete ventricosum]|nr:hypothetical protein BHE74_00029223 [Ensete ventricosum]